MKTRKLFLSVGLALTCTATNAMWISNDIKGVGPKSAMINPYFCIQDAHGSMNYALAPGESVDSEHYSGNQNYSGGSLRFGGCSADNTYLGYLGVSGQLTYTQPTDVHIRLDNAKLSNGHITGNIVYTPIQSNLNLTNEAIHKNDNWDFVGINLSGLEFGKVIDPFVVPNLSLEDSQSPLSDLTALQGFIHKGMNTVRVPISWSYMQLEGPGVGPLNQGYFDSYVKPLLETLTANKVNTIVDLHAYMRYSTFGKEYSGCGADGPCPDGKLILDSEAYKNFWGQLLKQIQDDPNIDQNYLLLDLMNEPVNVPDDKVFTIQTEIIKTLRDQGFTGYILVEGNNWSGLHSWTTQQWQATKGSKQYTNARLFTRDNFNKAGVTDLSKILINVHQYLDSDFSGTHDDCLSDLNTTGYNGFNLQAFSNYLQKNKLNAIVTEMGSGRDSKSCYPAMQQFLQYLKDNSARKNRNGFVGWTLWSAGHGWGNYNLRVTPESYQMDAAKGFLK